MSLSSSLRRGVVGALAAGAGAALVLGTGAVAASAATPSPSHSATACTAGHHLREAWGRMPEKLRADLKSARGAAQGEARRAAVKKVWTTAESGGYGPAAEVRAAWITAHRGAGKHDGAKLRPFPAALKADLAKLKGEKGADRTKGLDGIAAKAVAGGYGPTLQAFAKSVESSSAWKDCTATGS